MKDFGFKIKVSDLLLNVWSLDEIDFENKHTKKIANLNEEWISWKIVLEWLDEKTVLVMIKNLKAKLNEECDITWEEFVRETEIDYYDMKFVLLKHEEKLEDFDDDLGEIDSKDLTIDVEDMITQSILLSKPMVMKSPKAIQMDEEKDTVDLQVEDLDNFESWWSINWIYKK